MRSTVRCLDERNEFGWERWVGVGFWEVWSRACVSDPGFRARASGGRGNFWISAQGLRLGTSVTQRCGRSTIRNRVPPQPSHTKAHKGVFCTLQTLLDCSALNLVHAAQRHARVRRGVSGERELAHIGMPCSDADSGFSMGPIDLRSKGLFISSQS